MGDAVLTPPTAPTAKPATRPGDRMNEAETRGVKRGQLISIANSLWGQSLTIDAFPTRFSRLPLES